MEWESPIDKLWTKIWPPFVELNSHGIICLKIRLSKFQIIVLQIIPCNDTFTALEIVFLMKSVNSRLFCGTIRNIQASNHNLRSFYLKYKE